MEAFGHSWGFLLMVGVTSQRPTQMGSCPEVSSQDRGSPCHLSSQGRTAELLLGSPCAWGTGEVTDGSPGNIPAQRLGTSPGCWHCRGWRPQAAGVWSLGAYGPSKHLSGRWSPLVRGGSLRGQRAEGKLCDQHTVSFPTRQAAGAWFCLPGPCSLDALRDCSSHPGEGSRGIGDPQERASLLCRCP